jgi:hypothetical protein
MLLRVYRVAFDPYGSFNIVHCVFVIEGTGYALFVEKIEGYTSW